VNIEVTTVEDLPTANDDSASVFENDAVNIDVLFNDDFGGDGPASGAITISTAASNGTALVNGGGTPTDPTDDTVDYSPNAAYTGSDSFDYQICDANGDCDTATVSVTVDANDPVLFDVQVSASSDDAEERASGRVSLTSSDLELIFDKEDQTIGLRFNGITIPQGANIRSAYIEFQADESHSAQTDLIFHGEDADNAQTFVNATNNITLRDTTGASVVWNNVPAWVKDQTGTADYRTPNLAAVIQEIVNRTLWSKGNSLAIIITGTLGSKRVAESFNGVSAAAPRLYVEFVGGSPNMPPQADDDPGYVTNEDTSITIDVAANDSDPEDNLDLESINTSCSGCSDPVNGSLIIPGGGIINYSPDPNFNGPESFVYEICDDRGSCDTALVSITVDPVADPPTANDDSKSTPVDTFVLIDVAFNDSDPDGNLDPASTNTICANGSTGCSSPAGSLVNHGDGTFTYTPNPGYTGPDSFVYEICDDGSPQLCDTAAVNLTITPAGPTVLEVRVTASSDDAEERSTGRVSLTSSDLELVYDKELQKVGMRFNGITIPRGVYISSAYIQFKTDETPSDPTTLKIQGEDISNATTFVNATNNITNRPLTDAFANWDPPAWVSNGDAGTAQQTPDIASVIQEIVARPDWSLGNSMVIIITGTNPNKRVAESFNGDPAGAPLLHVEYNHNNPPVANNDSVETDQDLPLMIDVLANDTDSEDGTPELWSVASATNGTTTIIGNQIEYTPNAGFFGDDSFEYTVRDVAGATDTATVSVTVWVDSSGGTSQTFTEDTNPFGNPERGFYLQDRTQEQPPDVPDLWPGIDRENVKNKRDTEHLRVVRQYYHLDLYKTQDIPQTYLDILQDDLNFIRDSGMKIVPRFTYSWDQASVPPGEFNDTSKVWTLKHIETLMPILAQNADVIAFVEMGFVGLWGEFWGSDSGWTTDRWDYGSCSTVQNYVDVFPSRQSDREEIINRVLDFLPDEVKLALRYPRDKRAMFRDNAAGTDSLPLTEANAHTSLRKSRIGFHNDSVFTGDVDEQNTFFDCSVDNAAYVQNQIDWQHQDALFVPQGGETDCPYDPAYGSCQSAMLSLAERRFDVLNAGYCAETLQAWKDGGCYDEIASHLGYRIRLISATLAQTNLTPGDPLQLQIELTNDGYGKIYNPRDLELVLKHKLSGAEYFLPVSGHDPRFWLPGESKNFGITSVIPPTGIADGDYDIYLFLPDPDPALRKATTLNEFGDPSITVWSPYAIRLANQGIWDENTGYNDLMIDLTISSGP
jgi:hypothetical protein